MRGFIIIFILVLSSCGSRKVDLQKRITDIEYSLAVKTKELEIERKRLHEYMYTENFRADSIVKENGKTKIYNPSLEKKQEGKEENSDIEKSKEEDIEEDLIDNSQEIDKKVDKVFFNWWGIGVFIGGIVMVFVVLKRVKVF